LKQTLFALNQTLDPLLKTAVFVCFKMQSIFTDLLFWRSPSN